MDDPENWTFDVATSPHDDVKAGRLVAKLSRVTVSRAEFPDWRRASETAACIAVAVHGGMPTSVTPIY